MSTTDPLLTGPEAAARLGIAASTWRSYVARGYVPAADDPDEGNPNPNRRNPRWKTSTVERYRKRAGQGARTARKATT
jgi:hypothetical protein